MISSARAQVVNRAASRGIDADLIAHKEKFPGDTQQDICELAGIPYGQFNAALNGHNDHKAWHIAALARAGFCGGMQAICAEAGGVFLSMPRVAQESTFALSRRALLSLMDHAHKTLEVNFRAHADGVITKAERAECLQRLDQLIAAADVARQRIAELPVSACMQVKEPAHV